MHGVFEAQRTARPAIALTVGAALVMVTLIAAVAAAPSGRAVAAGEPVVFTQVDLAGDAVVITNQGSDAIDVSGWFVCRFPDYWPIPDGTMLDAGADLVIHAAAGTDSATDLYADGGFGVFEAAGGEVALYNSMDFESPAAIVAYVAWNGGSQRKSVAQAAGIWGEEDVTVDMPTNLVRTGESLDASAYSPDAATSGPVEEPAGESTDGADGAVNELPATGTGGLADLDREAADLTVAIAVAVGAVVALTGAWIVVRRRV